MRHEPKEIIRALNENNGKIRKTARQLSVSPGTIVFWMKRARSLSNLKRFSSGNLARKSTAPKHKRKTVMQTDDRERIILFRKSTGHCAFKIKRALRLPYHHNTIHRFLKKRGYVAEANNHRRPRYQETTHMYLKNVIDVGKLQMDVKYVTPELSGLPHTLFLYALIDIYSRYKQGVILPLLDQGCAMQAVDMLLPLLPFIPDFIQTDNGLEFQKRFDEHVRNRHKMDHHYIHKSNPNENAVIERSFRTDEEEFFFFRMKKPKDEIDLNQQYQLYISWYNNERLHLGINCKTPMEMIKK